MLKQILRGTSRRPSPRLQRRAVLTVECLEERAVPAITFTPATLPGARVAANYTQALTGNGGTAPYKNFAIASGALPAGLGISSTGTISGTPTKAGSFSFTVQADDSSTPAVSGSQQYTLAVALGITPPALPGATLGVSYSQALTASGGTSPYTFSLGRGGGLPPGLTLSSTGTVSGTPTATGSFAFMVQASDSSSPALTGSQPYTIVVIGISPTTLPSARVGASFRQTFTASGGTSPYTFTVSSGALPAGLSLSTAGTLSGTPTAAGSFTFAVTAKDAATPRAHSGSLSYTLTVNAATIALSPTTLPAGKVAGAYSQTIRASGGTAPYTYAVASGTLPAGLTLNATTGVISGTPTALGTSHFTIKATDSSTGTGSPFSGSHSYALTVTPAFVTFVGSLASVPFDGSLAAFQVVVQDALHHPLKGVTVSLRLIPLGTVGPAAFGAGSQTTAVTAANGLATFSGVTIPTRGQYQIEADADSLSALSNVFSVSLSGRHFPA
jgi:hypothetical protein